MNKITVKLDTFENMRKELDNKLAIYVANEELEILVNTGTLIISDMSETSIISLT